MPCSVCMQVHFVRFLYRLGVLSAPAGKGGWVRDVPVMPVCGIFCTEPNIPKPDREKYHTNILNVKVWMDVWTDVF